MITSLSYDLSDCEATLLSSLAYTINVTTAYTSLNFNIPFSRALLYPQNYISMLFSIHLIHKFLMEENEIMNKMHTANVQYYTTSTMHAQY